MRLFDLSIIIPVYNTERYLGRCIDSVLEQSYIPNEIILVDDGSTDDSAEICDNYASNYGFIKVIHQTNSGPGVARLAGVRSASSSFIMFIDSDDWIDVDFVECIMDVSVHSEHELISASGIIYDYEDGRQNIWPEGMKVGEYNRDDIKKIYDGVLLFPYTQYGLSWGMYNKVFPRKVIENALNNVPECIGNIGEDAAAYILSLTDIDTIIVTKAVGYHYRQHSESSVHRINDSKIQSYIMFRRGLNHMLSNMDIETFDREFNLAESSLDFQGNILSSYGITTESSLDIPWKKIIDKRVIIYGAGKQGRKLYQLLKELSFVDVTAITDKNYSNMGNDVVSPDVLLNDKYDYVIIAISDETIKCEIYCDMLERGIDKDKIIPAGTRVTYNFDNLHIPYGK